MSDWDSVKKVLQKPPTPANMKEAAEAFKEWAAQQPKKSSPTLCRLGYGPYPDAIPLTKVGDVLATNKAFYELMQKVAKGDRK